MRGVELGGFAAGDGEGAFTEADPQGSTHDAELFVAV